MANWQQDSSMTLGSIIFALIYVLISIVFNLPLLPSTRDINQIRIYFGIPSHILCCCILIYEMKQRRMERQVGQSQKLLLLAKFYFLGYILVQLWKCVHDTALYFTESHCKFPLYIVHGLTKLTFACLLMLCMKCKKDIPKRVTKYTYLRWSFIAAVCFSITSRFLVEEGERGYIEIVELSIKDPEYGLNIPANISKVEEYVPRLFKSWIRCSNQMFAPFIHYIFELLPFSTEFFTLATFDAIHTIGTFGHRSHNEDGNALLQENTNVQEPAESRNQLHICNDHCFSGLPKNKAHLLGGITIVLTIISVAYFITIDILHLYSKNHAERETQHIDGLYIFFGLQTVFRVFVLLVELIIFIHLRQSSTSNSRGPLPRHFELDRTMLIFTLLAFGGFIILRTFINIGISNYYSRSDIGLTMLLIFTWMQTAFQVIFIQEIHCRLQSNTLQHCRHFFGFLAVTNICTWLEWTARCKTMIMFDMVPINTFGAVEWFVVSYVIAPLILFGQAHAAVCFLEMDYHLKYNRTTSDNRPTLSSTSLLL